MLKLLLFARKSLAKLVSSCAAEGAAHPRSVQEEHRVAGYNNTMPAEAGELRGLPCTLAAQVQSFSPDGR